MRSCSAFCVLGAWRLLGAPAINVNPNQSLPGTGTLLQLLGGLQFVAVILTILGMIVGGVVWALSSHSHNPTGAARGRTAVLASGIAAVVIGAGPYLVEGLFGLGQQAH